ncbi:MAG: 16S rRNA (guanine(527)-N(7))-methyltransferase RsmG [Melioribacteraceae bacterium]|nr:16S rRNA (guanine(527)-N(7))-methyltransferase RsmG [Melioribacteraceae bacterium]
MKTHSDYLAELKDFFWKNGFNPSEHQLIRYANFCELFAEKNETLNLVSRKDIDNLVENHVFQGALISEYLPPKMNRFLDIGTGGGFPGIPFALSNPMMRGVLADSIGKKIDAVNEFIHKLKISNIVAENSRVEDEEFIKKHEGKFDLILSRATVQLIVLVRYALPLIKERAFLMAIKGGDLSEEIKKAEMKYKAYIKKSTIIELAYKPTNVRNEKEKKLILLELHK